jgi:hypothetical protein
MAWIISSRLGLNEAEITRYVKKNKFHPNIMHAYSQVTTDSNHSTHIYIILKEMPSELEPKISTTQKPSLASRLYDQMNYLHVLVWRHTKRFYCSWDIAIPVLENTPGSNAVTSCTLNSSLNSLNPISHHQNVPTHHGECMWGADTWQLPSTWHGMISNSTAVDTTLIFKSCNPLPNIWVSDERNKWGYWLQVCLQ